MSRCAWEKVDLRMRRVAGAVRDESECGLGEFGAGGEVKIAHSTENGQGFQGG